MSIQVEKLHHDANESNPNGRTVRTSSMNASTAASPISLMPHQQQIHDFLVDHPFAGAWLGVGAGKTLTTLSVLQAVRPMGHILVVAPVAIARSTWIDEIEKWGFPIRTKSLIVDQNDRKLSKAKRLERFQEVATDPPTMYFINQDLLTQPSRREKLITPAAAGRAGSPDTAEILDLLRARGPLERDELIDEYRDLVAARANNRVPAKAKIRAWIQELLKSALVTWEAYDCRTCSGAGCTQCRFGLVDQLPVQNINGQSTIIWPFPTVIIDESQGFKSHDSQRFLAMAAVRSAMTRLIELTGTPSPNGLHDVWSQVYLLDQGRALGQNVTAFRDRWFTPKMVPGTTTPAKWIPTANAEAEIHHAISHLVMSAQNTSLQLPALSIQDVNVTLPPDLLQAYKDFKRDLVLDIVQTHIHDGKLTQSVESIVAANQAVLTSKLMQFASGTLYTADPDDPATKGRYEVIHDKKIEMAEYLVRNSGGEPVLIAYHFKSDKEQLLTRFRKFGVDAQALDGSRDMVRRWNNKQIPVLLLHPAAAGHGLNLQHGGSTMIWYTLPFSLEHYLQTNGRLFRTGQTKPVIIHRLIAKGTQDERMPSVLAGKQEVQDDLIKGVSGDFNAEQALLAALEEEIREDLSDFWRSGRL
ncbi:SNF2-related protein [Streptomyces sp. NPDC058417]|uniref:SNF2-related protein n=1 Tax=unclassified Streptomyces TaxID=2593676 RepID=UPI003653E4DD